MQKGTCIFDQRLNQVLGCAIEIHKQLGPGLLESAYSRISWWIRPFSSS